MKFSAVILAGGRSRRMGRDKAWLPVGGQSLLERQIELARALHPVEIFISGRPDTDYAALRCPVLHDRLIDNGPLGGIERALAVASSPLLLVLAVDMPGVKASLLSLLGRQCADNVGVVPRQGGSIEPLAAYYPCIALPLATALLAGRSRAARAFAEHCVRSGLAAFHDLSVDDAASFANWNAPADLPFQENRELMTSGHA